MKREEKSFNLHQLLYADKESFQCKWSIQQKSVREKQTGRTRESEQGSELGLGGISSLIVLWDCPTAGLSFANCSEENILLGTVY